MRAEPVDPADVDWVANEPSYRVYFWTSWSEGKAPTSEEWRIPPGAELGEVLKWAELQREGRTYELFVEHSERRETPRGWETSLGLIRLEGENPVRDRTSKALSFSRQTSEDRGRADL